MLTRVDIAGFLKKVKAAPFEEISVATALDLAEAQEALRSMEKKGLVTLQESRKYPGEWIAVGTAKLLSHGEI